MFPLLKTIATFVVVLASAAYACAQGCVNLRDVTARGTLESIAVETRATDSGSVVRSRADFDRRNRLQEVSQRDAAGDLQQDTKYQFNRWGLAGCVTTAADGAVKRKCSTQYSALGNSFGETCEDKQGNVLSRKLHDPMVDNGPAIERVFGYPVTPAVDVMERSRFGENSTTQTITHLTLAGSEVANWVITRAANGKPIRDEVNYPDLSFSKREFHRDGTQFEHNFTADGWVQAYKWRDSNGFVTRELRSTPHSTETSTYAYDDQSRLVRIARQSGTSVSVRQFQYSDDDQGNWIVRTEFVDGKTVAETRREIHYRKTVDQP